MVTFQRVRKLESPLADNVLIFGAGASYSAGIPMLGGFVERMWECSIRKSVNGTRLSSEDIRIFDEAIDVINELDGYHGRASFDGRNIEDILSILSFNILGGRASDRRKLSAIVQAINRTIELTCTVKHPGIVPVAQSRAVDDGPEQYRSFWKSIFSWCANGRAVPAIITFNYDLVLERALLQILTGTNYNSFRGRFPFNGVRLKYHYKRIKDIEIGIQYEDYMDAMGKNISGSVAVPLQDSHRNSVANIEILKLHGSVNFPQKQLQNPGAPTNFVSPLIEPYILPPVFNKLSDDTPNDMWKSALEHLREAKNVIIVGYSLPRTDIYMQYFLKAALGPNVNFNRIFVFDPILYSQSAANQEMRERYEKCFSPQLQSRISFEPYERPLLEQHPVPQHGTFAQFVNVLSERPELILF